MTKAYSIFLTVLFTVFIGGVLVISALLPKEEFSEMENRFLQKPPELSIETVKNGKFMENAEKYVSDHIAGRDLWVAAKAWGERLSGKQENNGVYFAAQGAAGPESGVSGPAGEQRRGAGLLRPDPLRRPGVARPAP